MKIKMVDFSENLANKYVLSKDVRNDNENLGKKN